MGEPSPALSKISRMHTEKLTQYIETLNLEDERLNVKIVNLTKMTPLDEPRITELLKQRKRLSALMEAARDRLAGKLERRLRRDADPTPPSGQPGQPGQPVSRGYRPRGYRH